MQRRIARQIKRLCRAAHISRYIYVTKEAVQVNADVVYFQPTNTFIGRLATVLLEIPATKEMLEAQSNILQQLKAIDTTFWDTNG
jgi:hypothetical protein